MSVRLTVITVVRNDQIGLDKTCESVDRDLYFAEHIIVDGSDAPLEIKGKNIKRVIFGKDRGISHAFNKGVLHALGDYVIFINAGDTLVAGCGDKILRAISFADADCYWFSVYRCHSDGVNKIYRPRINLLKYAMAAPHQGMIVRREIFAEIGLFPLQHYAMDHHFALRLIERRPKYAIQSVDTVICYYPVGGHSTKGGVRPFCSNILNVLTLAPRHMPGAIMANCYLAFKSLFF